MQIIKLSYVQRVLMCGLVFMVNTFFGTHVSYAWTTIAVNTGMSEYSCTVNCPQAGYAVGIMGSALSTMVLASTQLGTAYCYCLTAAESQAIAACNQTSCGDLSGGVAGSGTGVYDLFNAFPEKPYGSCVPNQYKCGCPAGFKPYNGVSCDPCGAGYYCAETSSMGYYGGNPCPAGRYSNAGASTCVQCDPGYYAGGVGNSSCTPCSRGYYNSYYGQASCTRCPVYESSAVFYIANVQATSIISGVFDANTESSGAQGVGYCYLPVIDVGTTYSSFLQFQGFRGTNGQMIQTGSCKYN